MIKENTNIAERILSAIKEELREQSQITLSYIDFEDDRDAVIDGHVDLIRLSEVVAKMLEE